MVAVSLAAARLVLLQLCPTKCATKYITGVSKLQTHNQQATKHQSEQYLKISTHYTFYNGTQHQALGKSFEHSLKLCFNNKMHHGTETLANDCLHF